MKNLQTEAVRTISDLQTKMVEKSMERGFQSALDNTKRSASTIQKVFVSKAEAYRIFNRAHIERLLSVKAIHIAKKTKNRVYFSRHELMEVMKKDYCF